MVQVSILFLMMALAVLVLVLVFAMNSESFAKTLSKVLIVGFVVSLFMVPLLWMWLSYGDIEYVNSSHLIAEHADDGAFVSTTMVEDRESPVLPHTEESGEKAAPRGEILRAGSGMLTQDFVNSHVADLYSSDIEATKSLARQAAARLSQFKKRNHGISVAARFEKDEWSPEIADVFMRTFRAHSNDVAITQDSDGNATHVVKLRMKDRDVGAETRVKTYLLPFQLPHEREPTTLTAKFVNASWVTNAVDFRTGESVPDRYLIAVGEIGGDPTQAPLSVAFYHLSGRITQYLELCKCAVGDSRVTERIVQELISEQFVQNFVTSVEGKPIPQIVTVEAYLLDISNARMNQAVNKVVADLQLPEQYVKSVGASSTAVHVDSYYGSNVGTVVTFTLSMLVMCCGLKGIAWAFDRKP